MVNKTTLRTTRYGFPNPEHPCYQVKLELEAPLDVALTLKQVRGNGTRIRDYWMYNDGVLDRKNIWNPAQRCEIVVRLDWANDSSNKIELDLEDGKGKTVTLESSSTAPKQGGYWDANWKYYGSTVLTEEYGLHRIEEPVHLLLGLYADRLTDPENELRVVAIDPVSGKPEEVPCQVYGVSTWDKRKDEHCQPTTTVELAFMANVSANSSQVYLTFYGNPKATRPQYPTDLIISGEGYGLTVENNHYKIILHPLSGAIDEIHLKQNANVVFDHHLETNGSLHWNPCVYAPPRTWMHTSDWDKPKQYTTISGPIFFMTKRHDQFPDYPEVECSITYTFYRNKPYVLMTSILDVTKDLDVIALRNGEIVLNHNVVNEFAWKQLDGDINSVVIKDRPRHPTRGLDLDAWTPWWAFYNRDVPCALASINLELAGMRRSGGLTQWEPYFYMHWGPWAYCARPLVYTFATPNPQRVAHVSAGSSFYERSAFYPCRLGTSDETRFIPIEETAGRLFNPLSTSVTYFDTDSRVPEEWVPPILVSEFEELGDE